MNLHRYSFDKVLLAILLTSVIAPLGAAPLQVPRHLLGKRYLQETVEKLVVSHANWTPYPRTSEEWRTAVPMPLLERLIEAGETAINYRFEPISATIALDYVRNGDRIRHQSISFGKRSALLQLSIAESIEDKGRFMEAIINGLWSICEESYWGVPAHIGDTGLPDVSDPVVDLFAAETAAVMSLVDYFVGAKLDRINPLFRRRIYYETDRRIFVPMLTKSNGYMWMSTTNPVSNWNPWIMSNWIGSTLFLEPNPVRRAEMLHAAMKGLDLYLNSIGDDGGCEEGPNYWGAAAGGVFDCLELLGKATAGKVEIFNEPLIRKMAGYIYKAHISGSRYINFGDADPKIRPDGHMVYRFGQAVQDSQMIQFGKWLTQNAEPNHLIGGFFIFRQLEGLLNYRKLAYEQIDYIPVADVWIPDVQVLTARSDGGLFLGTHGGHNAEYHNHNDVGDLVIYIGDQPMIIDVGRGNYTSRTFSDKRYDLWYTQSNFHNLPIINGMGQGAGRTYAAQDVDYRNESDFVSLSMDLARAYPAEAGVHSWKRSVSLDRRRNCVNLRDEYVMRRPAILLQQSFMTVATVDASEPGEIRLIGEENVRLTLSFDASVWTLSLDQPEQTGPDYGGIPAQWDGKAVVRILLTHRQPGQSGQLHYRFDMR